MKKLILLISAFTFFLVSCGPTQNEAIAYNDSLMSIVDSLIVEHNLFLDQIDGHNMDSLKITHKLFSKKANASLEASKKILPFADTKEYRDVTEEYFTIIKNLAENEGKQMVDIMLIDTVQITQQNLDKINEIATRFDNTYSQVYDKILAAQIKFAKDWKFELTESK
ncbi:hypothetical protein [Sediminibacterium sp.]|uniref:LIC11966 family surface protein n=1 Tax=Sediminibacterium sp. TaxID=1917865 RepID=UPI002715A5C4|nr:hypothetical protein [Sediminibacterium sp.]MDO9000326.1 hypothetical protein [Bacteroidota bacterium]MDP3147105.1 hypothetical protein [Bacteroidota bacterium]MDP3567366.1 hypothetical protein [Sediminibacterium sp.]